MATVAILGGGISGLSCAYYLKTLGKSKIKYLFLLEKGPKFGGWIRSTKYSDGAVCEHGPHSVRIFNKPGYNALALVSEVGLSSEVLPVTKNHPGASNRLILAKDEIRSPPNKLKYLFKTISPFSRPLYHNLIQDLRTPKLSESDESVQSFTERRFGKEIADYLFDPLCRGICAGDSRDLSIRSLLPTVYEAEQKYGSVIKGIFLNKTTFDITKYWHHEIVAKAKNERWSFWSLKNGLEQLINALACESEEKGSVDLHFNAECTSLTFKDNKAHIVVDGEVIEVDHVFSSIPAYSLANIFKSNEVINKLLNSIESVTVATAYLEYDGFVHPYNAFGVLMPSCEKTKILGILFDSCVFPEQNGINRTRLTVMMGGKWYNSIFGDVNLATKDQLLQIAIDEVKKYLHVKSEPVRKSIAILENCIPQYVVGHLKKIQTLEQEISNQKLSLSLLGASYHGAGIADCIYNSRLSVEKFLQN